MSSVSERVWRSNLSIGECKKKKKKSLFDSAAREVIFEFARVKKEFPADAREELLLLYYLLLLLVAFCAIENFLPLGGTFIPISYKSPQLCFRHFDLLFSLRYG